MFVRMHVNVCSSLKKSCMNCAARKRREKNFIINCVNFSEKTDAHTFTHETDEDEIEILPGDEDPSSNQHFYLFVPRIRPEIID